MMPIRHSRPAQLSTSCRDVLAVPVRMSLSGIHFGFNLGPRLRHSGATVLLLLLLATPLFAETKTGASTLLLGGGARATALRGAYTAAAGDLDAMFFNPGGLSAIGRRQAAFTHADTAFDATYDVVQFASPHKNATWGVTLARLGVSDINGRDANRRSTGVQSASDVVGSISISRDFLAVAGVGATVKYFESRIISDRAATVAFDIGAVARVPNRPLWFGASVLNMGHGLRFIEETTPLPLTIAVGAATRLANILNFTVDAKRFVRTENSEIVTGVEYSLLPTASLRAGYASSLSGDQESGLISLGNWKGGLGLAIGAYQLDYAISSESDLDAAHRVTLSRVF